MSKELEAFLEYITVTKALSKKTIEAYSSDLSALETVFKTPLIKLDSTKLLMQLSQFDNKRTLNRKLSSVNAFFEFCHKRHFKESFKRFKLAKIPKNLPHYLEYKTIIESLELIHCKDWMGYRDYALILFLYASGLRISECLALRREDFEGTWLHVRHGKGEKERMVPIAKEALEALDIYLSERPFDNEEILLNYQGKPLSRISAYKITQKYVNVSPHVLRHSYATALILGGADLRVVQELLGHASLLTTQVYTHIQKQNLQETVIKYHPMAGKK